MTLYSLFWKEGNSICILLYTLILTRPFPKRKNGKIIIAVFSVLYLLGSALLLSCWQTGQAEVRIEGALWNLIIKYALSIMLSYGFYISTEMEVWDCAFVLAIAMSLTRLLYGLRQFAVLLMSYLSEKPVPAYVDILFVILLFALSLPGLALAYGGERNLLRARFHNRGLILSSLALLVLLDLMGIFRLMGNTADPDISFLFCMQELLFDIVLTYMLHNFAFRGILYYENNVLEALSAQRSSQYEFSQELIDTINIRSHDLKKQMNYLRKKEGLSRDFLKEMQDCVDDYDSILHTGHHTLDTVLTEKSMVCRQYEISFSCIADGQALSFMKELDIYTLFANLMDNAIEASVKLEKEKRSITLIIRKKDSFVSILEENCTSEDTVFVGGNPETTKEDKNVHGFGTRSMRMIAESYDGSLLFDRKGDIFRTRILLPLP